MSDYLESFRQTQLVGSMRLQINLLQGTELFC